MAGPVTAEQAVPPVAELPAHTTPLGMTFYTGTQFPAGYRHALFVSMKGSTARSEKVGYKLVRVLMKDGRPAGVEDFATGWLKDGAVSGRPVGLVTGRRRRTLRRRRQQGLHLPHQLRPLVAQRRAASTIAGPTPSMWRAMT